MINKLKEKLDEQQTTSSSENSKEMNCKRKTKSSNKNNEWTKSLSDCNWTRTQNHLGRKRTLNSTIECGFTLKRVRDMTRTYRTKLCSVQQ